MSLGDRIPTPVKAAFTGLALLAITTFSGCNNETVVESRPFNLRTDNNKGSSPWIAELRQHGKGYRLVVKYPTTYNSSTGEREYSDGEVLYEGQVLSNLRVDDIDKNGKTDIGVTDESSEKIFYGNGTGNFSEK